MVGEGEDDDREDAVPVEEEEVVDSEGVRGGRTRRWSLCRMNKKINGESITTIFVTFKISGPNLIKTSRI